LVRNAAFCLLPLAVPIMTKAPAQRPAGVILEESFLDVRAKLLEVAAVLDRIDRAADGDGDPLHQEHQERVEKVRQGIRILLSEGPDRAARLQLLFSRQYEPQWRENMQP